MRTLIQPDEKLKIANFVTFPYKKKEKSKNSNIGFTFKFYQKLFLILFASSTLLIFPESPNNSDFLCKKYHSIEACTVW